MKVVYVALYENNLPGKRQIIKRKPSPDTSAFDCIKLIIYIYIYVFHNFILPVLILLYSRVYLPTISFYFLALFPHSIN